MRAEVQQPSVQIPEAPVELKGRQEAEQDEPSRTPHQGMQGEALDRTLTGAKSIMPRWGGDACMAAHGGKV